MRSLLLAATTAAATFALANALSEGSWLAAPLGVLVIAGLWIITSPPAASADPSPASATEDSALATGAGR